MTSPFQATALVGEVHIFTPRGLIRSSRIREDAGPGACEVIYAETAGIIV